MNPKKLLTFALFTAFLLFSPSGFAQDDLPVAPELGANDGGNPAMRPPAKENADEEEGEGEEEDEMPDAMPTGTIAGAYEPTAAERNSKTSAQSLKLAENGKALVPIIVAQKSSTTVREMADDLAGFLEEMTGASFQVQTPDGKVINEKPVAPGRSSAATRAAANRADEERDEANKLKPAEKLPENGIVFGSAQDFVVPAELREGLAMRGNYHGREAFAIRTNSQRILLLGGTLRALRHVTTRFLEAMGCRWFAPGAHWKIIPKTPNLSFGMDITDRPSIGTRLIAFMDGAGLRAERGDQTRWGLRNYIGSSFGGSVGHMWHAIVEKNQAELLKHPEYFAEVNGKRMMPVRTRKDGSQFIVGVFSKLEMGHPAVRKMFVDYALEAFRRNPEREMVALSPTDGGGFSQSKESRALGNGSVSDAVYTMVNEVARAVKKEFPGQGKMVGCMAYREIAGPPSFPLEDNVYIELATLFNMSGISSAELMETWPKRVKNLGVYRYFSYYDAGGSSIPGGPVASIAWTTRTIRSDYAHNMAAIMAQSSNAFAMQTRGYLVATRLMWNPNADPEAILADFYEKSYGPAQEPMKRFYERLGYGAKRRFNSYVMGAAFRDLDEASKLAKSREDILWRISDLKMYMRWYYLRGVTARTPGRKPADFPAYRAAYFAMTDQARALAPTYMMQWNMVEKKTSRRAAQLPAFKGYTWPETEYKEPTLASIEAGFQEVLKQLPAREIPYEDFDESSLVPVEWSVPKGLQNDFPVPPPNKVTVPEPDPSKRYEYFLYGAPRHVFYSFGGEPLEVDLRAGMKLNRPNSNAIWTLSRPDEKGGWAKVSEGKTPMDRNVQKVSLKVPKKGLYAFNFHVGKLGGVMGFKVDRPASLAARGPKIWAAYFYVPKGTREIWLNSFNPHTVLQPDGKEVKMERGVQTVPVAPGMDGNLWRVLPSNGMGTQEFYNLPNVFASTPEALMVPRKVAEKDGLKICQ